MACPACGAAHDDDQRFCGACGTALGAPGVTVITDFDDEADATPVATPRSWGALVGAVVAIVAVMAGLLAVLSFSSSSDDDTEGAAVEYDNSAAPTAVVLAETGGPERSPFAELGLEGVELALRTDQSVRLVDPATGRSRIVEVDRSSGGEVWFVGRQIVMRSQSQTGPSVAVLDIDLGRYRLYGGFNFIPSSAVGRLVLGQEFGEFLGGGRWATLEIESLALDRIELPADAAFPFPVVIESGVVVEQGSQVVHIGSEGDRVVLGSGQITATGPDVVLLTDCDDDLECGVTSVASDGSVLATGPPIELPELSLGGATRVVSPDGRYLAHLRPNTRELFVIDIATGAPVPHQLGRTSARSMVWTSAGDRLLLADRSELRVVEVPTGASTVIELDGRVDQVALVPAVVSE